jgi:pimeloyl-ACP methyl ester carboxylesterase
MPIAEARMELNIAIDGRRIEAEWRGPPPDKAPTLVLLHEGLGCVAMWRDFPRTLAERTGYGVLTYSRPGYGASDPVRRLRTLRYMDEEAFDVLPAVLDRAGVRKVILVGHSDGASIATIYAGGRQDFRVRGLALMAPHFFVEDLSIRSILAAKEAYQQGDLRERLRRYHGDNVDTAFYQWNAAWLDPGSRNWRIDDHLTHVRVPILIVQGADDQYGTTAQIALAEQETYCPVDALVLTNCRHSPHLDQGEATLSAIADFAYRVLTVHEGFAPAA